MKNKTLRVLRVALACVLMAALMASGALAASYSAKVNMNTKVYKAPQKSSSATKAPKSMKVTLTASSGGWGKITYKGKTGYIPMRYLTLADPIKAYAVVKSTVYKKPGANKLGTLNVGQGVYVIGVNGKYAQLCNRSGAVLGYVKAANLSRIKSATAASGDSAVGSPASAPEKLRAAVTDPGVSKNE